MNSEQRKEQELADDAIKLMESGGHRSADADAAHVHKLGQQLRQMADDLGAEPDEELRAMLVAHLEDERKVVLSGGATTTSFGERSKWSRVGIMAASLLILGLLAAMLIPARQQIREAARRPASMDSDSWRNIKGRAGVVQRDDSIASSEKLPAGIYLDDDVLYEAKAPAGAVGDRSVDRDENGVLEEDQLMLGLPSEQAEKKTKLDRTTMRGVDLKRGDTSRWTSDTKAASPSRTNAVSQPQSGKDLFFEAEPPQAPFFLSPTEGEVAKERFRFGSGQAAPGGGGGFGGVVGGGRGGQGRFERKSDSSGPSSNASDLASRVRLGDTGTLLVESSELYAYDDNGRQVVAGRRKLDRKKIDRSVESMRRFGREGRGAEQYEPIVENSFIAATGGDAISTFAIDVDTASYANMRRFINNGTLPPPNAVRLEELINYFGYEYQQPKGDDPFTVNLELASCPWNDGHQLLRVGLQGKDVHVAERPPTNVVFLIDVSGSMQNENKLPLLKRGFQMLVDQLNEDDRVSIVTYAGNAGVALEPTSGDQKQVIKNAIEKLTPGGSTHGSAGIELAYQLAQQNFIAKGSNKVILATDGDLNVGVTSDNQLVDLIKGKAAEGVFLTVLGFGTGNLKDGKLEKLADNGNGVYSYIDSLREAHKVLVEQLSGALLTIAKDVKIQIEFNPAEVKSYRLLGYENRALKTEDFDNDRKDAGEIGAGHSVTALYEIVLAKSKKAQRSVPVGMKYQKAESVTVTDDATSETDDAASEATMLSKAAESGELATVAVRYKQPDAQTSQRLEYAIANELKSFASSSSDFQFAASVAGFGMLLRGSAYAGDVTFAQIEDVASGAIGNDASGYRAEFVDLVRKAAAIANRR